MDSSGFPLHPQRGFLPATDPAPSLPDAFAQWDQAAAKLPKWIAAGRVRRYLHELPALNVDRLSEGPLLERAMMVLSYFGHAWVWGEAQVARVLPANIAVPWSAVAARLGRPPVLSYASYALYNWRRLDPAGSIALGNIVLLQNFLGGLDEEWFILVHVDIEARAAPALRGALCAQRAVSADDTAGVCHALEEVATALGAMNTTLGRMPEYCDPYIYFNRVRPYIHGWKNNASLPDGLIYEGVDAYGGEPQQFAGETGAQSGIIPALDGALRIRHADDPLRPYLTDMRRYMPAGHRAFLETLEAGPDVRRFAVESGDSDLQRLYDACIDGIGEFRSRHLEYAANYINRQAQKTAANPTQVGTGSTPFMRYLRKHRDETAASRITRKRTTIGGF